MITITSNLQEVITQIKADIQGIDTDAMTREMATTVMGMMRERVHEGGKAADGSQIGRYSKGYLTQRSGAFKNASESVVKKGKTSRKDYGKYTKGESKGGSRIKYNRGTDPKVILSLTRQMESDMAIVPIEDGWGIGYNNSENYNKAVWNEKRYKKPVFAISDEEMKAIDEIADKYINL